ncbi:MAG: neuraminidase-like domain-containing protein [Fibrobacter sp.]|nr:neuraminidase-like domain-containing protein [Fibrobacter sp.]
MSLTHRNWYIRGTIHNANGSVFRNQGRILAYHLFPQKGWYWIAEANIDSNTGYFELQFETSFFQESGSPEIEFPTLQIRVTDYNYNTLWFSQVYNTPPTEMYLGDIIVNGDIVDPTASLAEEDVPSNPEEPGTDNPGTDSPVNPGTEPEGETDSQSGDTNGRDCKIYGTVKNALNYPLTNDIEVAAFCLYYQESLNEDGSKTGSFVKLMLGTPVGTDSFGNYEIPYSSSKIPAGLMLDGNAANGKDKASLFAEVHYKAGGTSPSQKRPCSFYSAPLVFNGQSVQEINFVLDLNASGANKSEFEKLDDLLNIYYRTVILYDKTILSEPHDRIAEFLSDVTRLPLVVGRENLDEYKVRAYFRAFQFAHEMKFVNVIEEDYVSKAAEYLYSLVLSNKMTDMSTLLSLGIDKCTEIINKAIAESVISSNLSAEEFDEKIWRKLQTSKEAVARQNDQLSPFTFFYLLLAKSFGFVNGKPAFALLDENSTDINDILFRAKHSALLNAFTDAGCNYRDLIRNLEENGLSYTYKLADGTELLNNISDAEIEDLKLLVEILDFCDGCADLVVGLYCTIKGSHADSIKKLEDILNLDWYEDSFWGTVISATIGQYRAWCTNATLNLPLDYFPGTDSQEQSDIAIRTLKRKIREKFPQTGLTKLAAQFVPAWKNLIGKIQGEAWKDFDLNSSDLDTFVKDNSITIYEDEKEKIKTLQRLFRLTNDAEAVSYLIRNEIYSASQIALVDEERFVAEHGLGMGDKELATNIHRLAKSFVASATLDIERYHGSLNESGDSILSIPRGFQKKTGEDADQDAAGEPVGSEDSSDAGDETQNQTQNSSNVAKQRLQNKSYANWKTLFSRINRNPGTQGQSILSASAYLLDLLEFLKQGHAYNRFIWRRPDVLKLNMTKANAEVSLPTIDLAIELLESLVSKKSLRYNTVIPFCNQTPDDATVEDLRANPCPWAEIEKKDEGSNSAVEELSGAEIEQAAMAALESKCYPMLLLKNFDRERASGILENLSLNFVSLSRKLHDDLDENISILLNGYAPEYLSNDSSTYTKKVWELWGLDEYGNENLFFPDKSRRVKENEEDKGDWHHVLSYLAFVLDRANLTYDEFVEIFSSPVFQGSGVSLNADSESFQLADVNGYRFNFEGDDENEKKIFFFKLSVFVRRRAALGWSIDEIARTWECSVPELAAIQELQTRLDLTALESALLLGKCSLTQDDLEKIFPIDSLFDSYPENVFEQDENGLTYDEQINKLCYQIAVAANVCLKMDPQDAVLILQNFGIIKRESESKEIPLYVVLRWNLEILYKYNLWITKNNLSVEDYLFLRRIDFPVSFGDRTQCNTTIDELEILRNSSLSVNDLKSIFEPELMNVDEAFAFACELNSAVQESLKECVAQEKEKLPPVTTTGNSPSAGANGSQNSTGTSTVASGDSNATPAATVEYDYDTAILGLLKTLGREDAEEIFNEWRNGFPSYNGDYSETCLCELFRYVSEPSDTWKDDLENAEAMYEKLREELVAERTLTFLAEKFSMTADVIAELLKKLESNDVCDFVEWVGLAEETESSENKKLSETNAQSLAELCNRVVRCAALYQFTQSVELGFEWDWNLLGTSTNKYSSFKDVLYAFAASSQIMGEVYKFAELKELSAGDGKLQVSDDVFNKIRTEAGIESEESPSAWCKFADLLQLYRKTNSLPDELRNLLQVSASVDVYSNCVDALEENLKLVRTNSEWNKFIQGVHDKVRQSKRNALAAVVCHESQNPATSDYYPVAFVDENDIYSYYLFDVKMEPDMAISRTVQAVSCIQLYVQRALMGLEGGYTLNDTQKEQWEWMKNFQVWVANRKVFLYPENWIDGDLREDKTPFFKDFEDRLAEIGSDQDALTEALGDYLKKVSDTSEIDIVGACKQDGGVHEGTIYTLHIIGCTRGEPHAYYYRTYEATALYGGSWSPWEEVPVEIDGASIQPAILGGHLHILWLQVVQGQRQKKSGEDGGQQAAVSVEYFAEIRLKWASYTGTKWTGVKVGKQAVYDVSENQLDFILGENETLANRYFIIDVSENADSLILQVRRTFPNFEDVTTTNFVGIAGNDPSTNNASTYVLKTETLREYKNGQRIVDIGSIFLSPSGDDSVESRPKEYKPDMGELLENHCPAHCKLVGNMFHSDTEELVLLDGTEIFRNTRGPFKLLSVNMGFISHMDWPFFFMDSQGTYLVRTVSGDGGSGANSVPNYYVEMISNPQTPEFRRRFLQGGTKWLYTRETEALPVSDSYYYSYSYYNYYFSVYLGYYTAGDWQAWDLSQTLFEHSYLPGPSVAEPFPSSMVDFSWGSSSAIYNWELFFFVPMLLADKMLAEQNYAAALEWLQLVFDPRMDLSKYEKTKRFVRDLPKGAKYWKFLPFFANQDADRSILTELSMPSPHDSLPDYKSLQLLIDRWKNDPFDPQMIARYRNVAYQKYVVMKYLDALIGWGDQLFTQDTTESVNLAIQMYILAAEILGPKSAEVPGPGTTLAATVGDMLKNSMGVMNNAFVTYEDTVLSGKYREKETPQRLLPGNTAQLAHTTGMMFYFDVPRNETLMAYWDTVADRLYKIRNSLNIEGVKRTLALFAPPIDPAMLVKARANGVSISDALADASSALPYYRFKVMVAKAIEIVRDVQRVGQELLDAIEKFDAETLALLRVTHEKTALTLQKTLTELDITELEKELEAVETEEENLQAEQEQQNTFFKKSEQETQYEKAMEKVKKVQETVENMKKAASVAYKLPDLGVGAILNGLGGPSFDSISLGGTKIAENLVNAAEGYASQFAQKQVGAALKKVLGEQNRVEQSWEMQKTAKANQIKSVQKKKTTAEIKIDYAKKQLENFEREIELKDEMYEHLSEKYTNKDLYTWLKKETGSVYKMLFQLAAKVARKAEKCYHFEIGDTDENPKTAKTFIKGCGSYWDGLHSGLLAGEKLLADLHAMEVAYLDNDKNELEITRPVSLKELYERGGGNILNKDQNPLSLLHTSCKCTITLPENLFKLDFPNHYFRRIRDVRIEVIAPDYIGHYLNAELSLTSNTLDLKDGRTIENRIGIQTSATSTAHKSGNKFDFRFNGDKFNPFEGAGAISLWNLSVNGYEAKEDENNEMTYGFNPNVIDDVIIYISYTARMGKTKL